MTGSMPDYACIVISANNGIQRMTKEHLGLCLALKIPFYARRPPSPRPLPRWESGAPPPLSPPLCVSGTVAPVAITRIDVTPAPAAGEGGGGGAQQSVFSCPPFNLVVPPRASR